MDLRTLLFSAFGDHWILLVEPFSNRCGRLFVSLLQRFLRCVPPALEVLANRPDWQPDSVAMSDQLTDRLTRPQGIVHLQLVGGAVLNQPLHFGLFGRGEQTARTRGTASPGNLYRLPSTASIRLTGADNRIPAQLALLNRFHDCRPRKTHLDRPPSTLVQCVNR